MERFWFAMRARLRSLFFPGGRAADLDEELQQHLAEEADRLQALGASPDDARREAQRLFGGMDATREACRDTWGRTWLDTLLRDLRFAARSVRRAPLVAGTIVVTVGLGLGLMAAVFSVLNAFVFRVDDVHRPHELFALERRTGADDEGRVFSRDDYDALRRETSVFVDAFAQGPALDRWVDGRRLQGASVTGNAFDVLGVHASLGRRLTPDDDVPRGPVPLVLSHRAWTRLFAGRREIVGSTVQVAGVTAQVVGVMPESFRGLAVAPPDFWAPYGTLDGPGTGGPAGDRAAAVAIIGRLRPGLPRDQALAELAAWDRQRTPAAEAAMTAPPLDLVASKGTVPLSGDVLAVFAPLFLAFGLVLVIGCANVANLLLARALARQREIGIRLAIGASRGRLVRQLLTESVVLALAAAAVGWGLSRAVLALLAFAVARTMPADIGDVRLFVPPVDWRVVAFLVSGALLSTVAFALAPALQATRLDLVRAVHGQGRRSGRPASSRHALVALQVTGTVMLLVCAAVFLRAAMRSATVDPGIRTSDVLSVQVGAESTRAAVLAAVRSNASVREVAAAASSDLGGRPAIVDAGRGPSPVTYQFVSPTYFDLLDVRVLQGRGFSSVERSAGAAVAVVSNEVAQRLWPGASPLGQAINLTVRGDDDMAVRQASAQTTLQAVVIGVAADVPGFRFLGTTMRGPGVYVPTDVDAANTTLLVRVRGDALQMQRQLTEALSAIDAGQGSVSTLATLARMEAYFLALAFWLTLAIGALALVLTLSGLFSVLSYIVEQRTREMGVRLALGSTSRGVAALVLTQMARPVGIGLLAGAACTLVLSAALLASPAAADVAATVELLDPVAYGLSVLAVAVASIAAAIIPARRASRVDPFVVLRSN